MTIQGNRPSLRLFDGAITLLLYEIVIDGITILLCGSQSDQQSRACCQWCCGHSYRKLRYCSGHRQAGVQCRQTWPDKYHDVQKDPSSDACLLICAPQVLLLDELTTFLDGEDQRGVLEAVRKCVGGPDQARHQRAAQLSATIWSAGCRNTV